MYSISSAHGVYLVQLTPSLCGSSLKVTHVSLGFGLYLVRFVNTSFFFLALN